MASHHRPLLGRLARYFNEVIATDALRLVLHDPSCNAAFLSHLGQAAGIDLSEVCVFEREVVAGSGRLDLVGVTAQGQPLLIIEAKFGHDMSVSQMSYYRDHQRSELQPGQSRGVLALLVPASRLREAQEIMSYLASEASSEPGTAHIEPIALSWEDCLDVLDNAVAQDRDACSPAADLVQLRSICSVLGDWTSPLNTVPASELPEHLRVVLRELRDRLPTDMIGPSQSRDPDFSEYRYYRLLGTQTAYAVGLTETFSGEAENLFWLRFHRVTPGFERVSTLLRRSPLAREVREHRGHLWLPLRIDSDRSGPELVTQIVAQVEGILAHVSPNAAPGREG